LDFRWNFRYAHHHENDRRTLVKAYGLRFVVTVDGVAGKFSLRNTVLNVGNGLALLGTYADTQSFNSDSLINPFHAGITTVIGEFFLLYFAKEKKNVAQKKYDYVIHKRRNALAGSNMAEGNPAVAVATTANCNASRSDTRDTL